MVRAGKPMKLWFFDDHASELLALVECDLELAQRLAEAYNRDLKSGPPVGLIANSEDPSRARIRVRVPGRPGASSGT